MKQLIVRFLFENFIPILISILSLLVYFLLPESMQWLKYERSAINNGELWRFLTANFTHTNFYHWLLNTIGLILFWSIYRSACSQLQHSLIIISLMLANTLLLYVLFPDILWYVGLSGSLHGFLCCYAIINLNQQKTLNSIMLLVLTFKVIWEQVQGPSQESMQLIAANVVIEAHLLGYITGLIGGFSFHFINYFNPSRLKKE